MIKLLISFLLTLSIFANSTGDNEIPKDLMKIGLTPFSHEGKKYIAAHFKNYPHWHTYWTNPGDAGLPIEADFTINGEKKNVDIYEWPIPKKFNEQGDIVTFGFEDEYSLFYSIPNDLKIQDIKIHFKWLICKNICIPGEKIVNATFREGAFISDELALQVPPQTIKERFLALPPLKDIPSYLDISLVKLKDNFALLFNISKPYINLRKDTDVIIPYTTLPLTYKRETLYQDNSKSIYGKYTFDWDGEYTEPEMPLPQDGKFQKPINIKLLFQDPVSGETYTIIKEATSIALTSADQFETFFKTLTPILKDGPTKVAENDKPQFFEKVNQNSSSNNIFYYFVLAFFGGLLLNIMPCVLPVISLKLFGLVKHSQEGSKSIFKHNISYSLGVMFTFLALALVISVLKASGQSIGWGFQLQSASFVAIMIVIIFVMALNLFGLFEFKTPGGSKLGSVELRDSFSGDFLGGVLATILSTPCSAPFLGTALTFAFSESHFTIFTIFMAIGLGLSFPFILTAFFPRMIHFLPKPGMWMINFKYVLAFTLILTTIWLIDVYAALTDSSLSVMQMNTALSLLFFVFLVRKKMTKNILVTLLITVPALYLIYQSQIVSDHNILGDSSIITDKNKSSGLYWQKWSIESMNKNISDRKLTFIDFTAKWCMTCKVNEKLVIDTNDFKKLVSDNNMELLIGDWTRRDPEIGEWLKTQGFVGVPAYFLINKNGELIKLGETITINELKKNIE